MRAQHLESLRDHILGLYAESQGLYGYDMSVTVVSVKSAGQAVELARPSYALMARYIVDKASLRSSMLILLIAT